MKEQIRGVLTTTFPLGHGAVCCSTHMNWNEGIVHLMPDEEWIPLPDSEPEAKFCRYCRQQLTEGVCVVGCGGEQG